MAQWHRPFTRSSGKVVPRTGWTYARRVTTRQVKYRKWWFGVMLWLWFTRKLTYQVYGEIAMSVDKSDSPCKCRVAKCLIAQVEKSTTKGSGSGAPAIFLLGNKNDMGSLIHEQACTDLRLITDYWISLSAMHSPGECRHEWGLIRLESRTFIANRFESPHRPVTFWSSWSYRWTGSVCALTSQIRLSRRWPWHSMLIQDDGLSFTRHRAAQRATAAFPTRWSNHWRKVYERNAVYYTISTCRNNKKELLELVVIKTKRLNEYSVEGSLCIGNITVVIHSSEASFLVLHLFSGTKIDLHTMLIGTTELVRAIYHFSNDKLYFSTTLYPFQEQLMAISQPLPPPWSLTSITNIKFRSEAFCFQHCCGSRTDHWSV